MNCEVCGNTLDEAATSCFNCGARVEADNKVVKKKAGNAGKIILPRNSVMLTVVNFIFSIMFMVAFFVAACIFMLAQNDFDEFYARVIFADIVRNIDFWILTSSWYSIAMYIILVLLILLILCTLKKKKYVILNYVGIPMIINGIIFFAIGFFPSSIGGLFEEGSTMNKLFEVLAAPDVFAVKIGSGLIIASGIILILLCIFMSSVHKKLYARRCDKG